MTQDTKAPERITVIVEGAHGGVYIGREGENRPFVDEYVRLDLLTTAEAERDAEKARADALAEEIERLQKRVEAADRLSESVGKMRRHPLGVLTEVAEADRAYRATEGGE